MSLPDLPESVLVALVGLVGVLAGQSSARRMHRTDYEVSRASAQVAGLRSLVDALTTRVATLEAALAAAEARAEGAAQVRQAAETRTWHALTYARAALTWGRDVTALLPPGTRPPPEPAPPPEIDPDI